jgi:hypothetical protein
MSQTSFTTKTYLSSSNCATSSSCGGLTDRESHPNRDTVPGLCPTGFKQFALGGCLNARYSSDLGHWNLHGMPDAVAESWGAGCTWIDHERWFRDFVFPNPVRAKAEVNPEFPRYSGGERGTRTAKSRRQQLG